MRSHLAVLSILSVLAFSCKKDEASSEVSQIDASYHLKPFNYTADEGDHLTGVCFAFSRQAVESSNSIDISELEEGGCPESTNIKKIDNPDLEITTKIMTSCEPYLYEQVAFAQLHVYDVSYKTADFSQFETDASKAQGLCLGLESFALLLISPQASE